MDHVALNGPGPNDGDLNDDIVKTFRLQPRQRGHLRAALDLKNSDRVRLLHDLKGLRVISWNVRQVERPASFTAKLERILHDGHHAETKQIDLHHPKVFAIILVPLGNHAAGHGGILERNKRAQVVLTDDHAP